MRKLRLRRCSHLSKIVGVITLLIWDNVNFYEYRHQRITSISCMNHMLL